MADADYAAFMPDVAKMLLGDPNPRLSSKDELRFGTNGSISVDLKKGTYFDHQDKVGGGVRALIAAKTGVSANGGATDWLRSHGFPIDDGDERAHAATSARPTITARYDYTDEAGDDVFQVVRMEPKTFRQRRRAKPGDDPEKVKDGWVWSVKGVRLVPFRLPELLEAIAAERTVFVVEGEKDVLNLAALGITATCNPMGAGKWPVHFPDFFKGANVVVIPDNDEPGRSHRDLVAASLAPVVSGLRVLEIPGLPEKGDVSDWIEGGGTAEAFYPLVERYARPWAAGQAPLRFGGIWFADVDHQIQEPEWLIDDLLTIGDKSLVFGQSQSGKSFLATDLAMAIARGVDVFGRKVRRGGVAYVAAEGKKGFRKRLKAYRMHHQLPVAEQVPFMLIPSAVDLYAAEGDTAALQADLRIIAADMERMGVKLDLIVLDTWAAVSPGANENASEDVSRIVKNCERLQEVSNAHLMIVHHKNAGGEKPRGHTSLYAGIDNAIEVICDEQHNRSAKIVKLKDAQDGQTLGFRLQSVTIGARDDGKEITSCVVDPVEARERTGKGPKLSDQQRIALGALRAALIDHGEPAPGALQLPFGVQVVRGEYWKREFLQRGFVEEPNENTFRSAFKRVGEALKARGVIGTSTPYVWIAREPST